MRSNRKLVAATAGLIARQVGAGGIQRQPQSSLLGGVRELSALVGGGGRHNAARCGASLGYHHQHQEQRQRFDGGMVLGGGFAVGGVRGMARKYKVPESGGVEGFDDAFLKGLKRKTHPIESVRAPPAENGVWYGKLPDSGSDRHYNGMDEETVSALHTILDIENEPGGIDLPSMEEIESEETEEERLKALRKAMLAAREAKLRATRVAVRDEQGRSGATGKRKTAVARVTIWPGDGNVTVNNRPLDHHVRDITHRGWMLRPFLLTNTMSLFDVSARVHGGGSSGQAQALRHGIARALQQYEPSFRPVLKKAGMLTRDPRMVERKKPGLRKARRAFQWVKR